LNLKGIYKDKGWNGVGDWLGTDYISPALRVYRPFEEARGFARSLNLQTRNEWREYKRGNRPDLPPLPDDIPRDPGGTYKDKGWKGMSHWLGTDFIATTKRTYQSFEEAREFARSLHLQSGREWTEYTKGKRSDLPPKPVDIPTNPQQTYRDKGWNGVGDWLGTKPKKKAQKQKKPNK
jgi:hypothetical protein